MIYNTFARNIVFHSYDENYYRSFSSRGNIYKKTVHFRIIVVNVSGNGSPQLLEKMKTHSK